MRPIEFERDFGKFKKLKWWYKKTENFEIIDLALRLSTKKRFGDKIRFTNNSEYNLKDAEYLGVTINKKGGISHLIKTNNEEVEIGLDKEIDIIDYEKSGISKEFISTNIDEVLDDLKYKVFIQSSGRTEHYRKIAYNDIWNMLDVLKGSLEKCFGEESTLLEKCLSADFPFPEVLELRVDRVRYEFYIPALNSTSKSKTLGVKNELKGVDSQRFLELQNLRCKKWYVDMAKKYVREVSSGEDVGESDIVDKCNFVIEQALRVGRLSLNITDIRAMLRNSSMPILMKGDRLATKSEREHLYYGTHVEMKQVAEDESKIACLAWAYGNDDKEYSKIKKSDNKELKYEIDSNNDNDFDRIEKVTRKLYYSLNWIESLSEREIESLIHGSDVEYLESAEDEIKDGTNIEEMIKQIYQFRGDKLKMEKLGFTVKLIRDNDMDTIHKSLRIVKYILNSYELVRDKKTINEMSVIDKAYIVLQKQKKLKQGTYDFHKKICKSVVDWGKVSEKQARFVNEAFDYLTTVDNELRTLAVRSGEVVKIAPEKEKKKNTDVSKMKLADIYGILNG